MNILYQFYKHVHVVGGEAVDQIIKSGTKRI